MKKFIISIAVFALMISVSADSAQASMCTVNTLTANQTFVSTGTGTTLNWSTSGCATVSITPAQNPDNRPPSGSVPTGPLTATTTFTVVGRDSFGATSINSKSITITVTGSTTGPNGPSTPTTPTARCVPTDFVAALAVVQYGEGTTLHWDSENCDSAAIHPAAYPGDRPPYGSIYTGAIYATTQFSLTVYDANDNIGGQRYVTVYVDGIGTGNTDECQINDFDADDSSIDEGDSTEIVWNTTDCDYVTITDISGQQNADGSRNVSPDNTQTYTLKAYDFDGNLGDTRSLTIRVTDTNDQACSVDDFYPSPTLIDRGSSSTLRWTTSGDVDYVTISGLSGNRSEDGSVSVSPYSTTSYTLRAYCNNGDSETDTATVTVRSVNTDTAPQAITTVATVLGGTQARLNGIAVPNTTTSNTTAWFEWGLSGSFGNRTSSQTVQGGNSSQYYSDLVSGLVPGAAYFYRAVVQNSNGIAYGDTVRFQTTKTSSPVIVTPTPVVHNNVVVAQSAPSLLKLTVESNYDRMCVNGTVDYTISYQNVSNQVLEKAVLQFSHPKELSYLNASRGTYEVVDRTMTIALGDIRPGEQGIITVHARVNETAITGNLTVATATVVYTNAKTRAQEDAIAYSLITVSNDCPNLLGASVFGFGSFLPNTLIGWLILILVILALIVLSRNIYRKNNA